MGKVERSSTVRRLRTPAMATLDRPCRPSPLYIDAWSKCQGDGRRSGVDDVEECLYGWSRLRSFVPQRPDADIYRLGTQCQNQPVIGISPAFSESADAEDLLIRICRMARNTLHPALAVSFLPSSIDLGLYVTGTSTI